jgi:hypothetical protein
VEWVIEGSDGSRVSYELEDDKLTRKSTVGKTSEQHTSNVHGLVKDKAEIFHISIRVDGSHVRIINKSGAVLDDYNPQSPAAPDFSNGRVGVKTPAEFTFTGGGQ